MKKIGIISYNIYCNFTNYGSALQSWALYTAANRINSNCEVLLVDYCPDILTDKDTLNPFNNMWDKDEDARKQCELTLPAIRENYYKFNNFYNNRFTKTKVKYTSKNFYRMKDEDQIDGYICGADTIFCIDEFGGFDDGYYANYPLMQGKSVSYAASFGDAHFDDETYATLNMRVKNFLALGIRESKMIPYVSDHTNAPVQQTIDPTLLLTAEDYESITERRIIHEPYILYYSRRYNLEMEQYVTNIAEKTGLKVVEISLRASNEEKGHIMYYQAGVEEFLSLVKHSEMVITNSFHGLIFAVQFKKSVYVFSREQCDDKISELMNLLGMGDRLLVTGQEGTSQHINYEEAHKRIGIAREKAKEFLKMELDLLERNC